MEGWHSDVSSSRGIRALTETEMQEQQQKFVVMARQHPRMEAYLAHHRPFYDKLAEAGRD